MAAADLGAQLKPKCSTTHAKGSGRPKSHSGKYKPGSRKQSWSKLTAKIQSSCQGCKACQAALTEMRQRCAELTSALAIERDRGRHLENRIQKLPHKGAVAVYVRPVPSSWQQ